MAKRVKKEGAPEPARAPRRRTAGKTGGSPQQAAPELGAPPAESLEPSDVELPASPGERDAAPLGDPESPAARPWSPAASEEGAPETVREPAEERPGHDRVAERAYELYQQRGGEPGRDLDDWLAAERELARRRG
jgi:hypothetical protein